MNVFVSTNNTKYQELKKYDPDLKLFKPSSDVLEVISSPLDIIMHKTNDIVNKFNLNDCIIKDSTFEIWDSNKRIWIPVIDIKYTYNSMKENTPIRWVSYLSYYKSNKIKIFKEYNQGHIEWDGKTEFYDTFIINKKFISEHIKENNEYKYCSRTKAYLRCLNNDLPDYIIFKSDIKNWDGEYQKEY